MQTKIIYEDDHLLVCQKPAGLAAQSGRVGQPDVVSELKKYLGEQGRQAAGKDKRNVIANTGAAARSVQPPYLGVVHRLDQPVEGLLVFAKNQKAAAQLTKQLSEGSLNKQYYAVVCGKPVEESGELVDYLVKDGNVARVVDAQAEGAKKAVLQYKVVGSLQGEGTIVPMAGRRRVSAREELVEEGKSAYILDVHIDTGRFHQIRVQLSHAGLPIVSDSKYGTGEAMEIGRSLGFRHVALFAYRLELGHPVTNKKLSFEIQPQFLHEN